MKKIKIMESVLMLVTVVVLVWLILEEKNAVAFFSATILIPFQIINFICLQKWIYKSVQTTEEKLEQIDRGNKTLAEFEVGLTSGIRWRSFPNFPASSTSSNSASTWCWKRWRPMTFPLSSMPSSAVGDC